MSLTEELKASCLWRLLDSCRDTGAVLISAKFTGLGSQAVSWTNSYAVLTTNWEHCPAAGYFVFLIMPIRMGMEIVEMKPVPVAR